MQDYGIIFLYENNYTRKIIVKENNNLSIRIITLNSLKKEIEFFTPKPFIYFIENGLNENSNIKSTLAVIIKNKLNERILKYFSFKNSINEKENDVPFYHPNIPDGYSLFCTQFEYIQLMEFLKKNEKRDKKEEEELLLEVEPIPRRKNFLCQICKIKFGNYIEHINSSLHSHNKSKYSNVFKKIQNTFKRIADNNEQEKINFQNEKNILDNSMITNNITTKCDSFIVSDENKDINKKNITDEEKTCKKDDNINESISMKDIMMILDNIDSKSKNISFHSGKRKKNEKNKSFFKDNYIYDLQSITGKIYHYKYIFNK